MSSPCGRVASAALLSMASAHHFPRDVKYLPPTPRPPLLAGWEIFSPSLPPRRRPILIRFVVQQMTWHGPWGHFRNKRAGVHRQS